jgi:hypothetical protein
MSLEDLSRALVQAGRASIPSLDRYSPGRPPWRGGVRPPVTAAQRP